MKFIEQLPSQVHADARAAKVSCRDSAVEAAENEGWPPKPVQCRRKGLTRPSALRLDNSRWVFRSL